MNKEELEKFEASMNLEIDPVITLKAVWKNGKHIVQPAFDQKMGWYRGVERLSEEDKRQRVYSVDPETVKIVLVNNYEFNLKNEVDLTNWNWVKHLPIIAGSRAEAEYTPSAMFYVYVEGREATKTISRSTVKYQALQFVLEDNPSNYIDRALILGQDFAGEHPSNVKEWLCNKAEQAPEEIIRLYQAKNTGVQLLYLKAKSAGVIKEDQSSGVIKYGNKVLGMGDDGAIAFLMGDGREITELIKREVYREFGQEEDQPKKVSKTKSSVSDLISSSKEDSAEE